MTLALDDLPDDVAALKALLLAERAQSDRLRHLLAASRALRPQVRKDRHRSAQPRPRRHRDGGRGGRSETRKGRRGIEGCGYEDAPCEPRPSAEPSIWMTMAWCKSRSSRAVAT